MTMPEHARDFRSLRALVTLTAAILLLAAGTQEAEQSAGPQTRADLGQVPRLQSASAGQLRLTADRAARLARASAEGLDYVPGEALVKFRAGASVAVQAQAVDGLARRDATGMRWIGDVALVTSDVEMDARALAAALAADPSVEYAEPNYLARLDPVATGYAAPLSGGAVPNLVPNDPDYASRQWNFDAIGLPRAWDISPGGDSSVIVAIVDTGVTASAGTMTFRLWTGSSFVDAPIAYATNTDLSASRFVAPMDFVFFDAGGPVIDMDGHGSHVAATVAEDTNNGFGLAGIAYNVRIMPVKVCLGYWEFMFIRGEDGVTGFANPDTSSCPFSALAEGIRYAADNGARIINMSLGGTGQSNTLRDAMRYAIDKGVFISMSGGNRAETGNQVGYPAFYGQQFGGAMAASSVGRNLAKAYYSSTGSYIEIAAPGGDARSGGSGGVIWQSTVRQPDVNPFLTMPRFDRYEGSGFQGTSMAAPHVAGLAALLMSRGITSPAHVEGIITQTARDLGASGKDDEFGHGLIQPRAALFGLGIR